MVRLRQLNGGCLFWHAPFYQARALLTLFSAWPTSQADQSISERLQETLRLVDVRVLDHIVVGSNEHVSFAESGLL